MADRVAWRFVLALGLALIGVGMLLGLLASPQGEVHAAWAPSSGGLAAPPLFSRSGPGQEGQGSPPAAPLFQATSVITVCNSGCPYTSVQAAVSAIAPGGTVKVAQGVYTDTDGDGHVIYITKSLTLQGGFTVTDWSYPYPAQYPTVLNGEGTAQVVYIGGGATVVVEGFHIRSGYVITDGAGVYVAGGAPALRRNRIYSNTAGNNGGGVYVAGGEPSLENNLIYGNEASRKRGGGIYVAEGAPVLQHNVLYNNQADSEGGGVYIASGTPVISGTVVFSNTATAGGGIYVYGGAPTLDYNDVWGNLNQDYVGVNPGTHSISTDPLLMDPSGADFRPQPGSPCIDQVPITQTVEIDYEGRARPFGEHADIGAHEFYTGTCFARVDAGRVYTTVQAAVDAASSGAMIQVAGYCAGIEMRAGMSQTVYVVKGLTLQGGYTLTNWALPDSQENPTVLDAQGQGRVIYIDSADPVVVEGIHIYNGDTGDVLGVADNGGGIYIAGGSHTVRRSKIYSNTASGSGGGVYIASGAQVYENEVYSNTAGGIDFPNGGGGGIYIGDADALVHDNTVYGNQSTGGDDGGGGICIGADATVWDNTVHDNQSTVGGGGIFIYNAAPAVRWNVVYGNTAGGEGGGIYVYRPAGGALIEHNTVYSNTASGGRGGGGIYSEGGVSSGPTIRHNIVSSNTTTLDGGGIYAREYSLIQGNELYNNSADNGGGVAVTTGNPGNPGPAIERNRIYGNSASTAGGGIWTGSNDQATIQNNLVYDNNGDGLSLGYDAVVQNNTIYHNTGDGIHQGGGAPTIRNNIVVSNTNYGIYGSVTGTYCDVWGNSGGNYGGGAIAGTGTITANPQFVNPGVDFHLQASSPCRDAADPNNYPSVDYDGYARPFGPQADMGAYEFYTGTCFAQIDGATRVYTTVQAAVDAAGVGALVKVAGICTGVEARAGLSQTIYLSSALTLRGGYTLTNWITPTAVTVLDPQGAGRGVYITGTDAITVDGFLIQHGSALTGGGLYVAAAVSPTIQNVVFYSNTASYGGGFASAGGNPRLFNNTFVSNTGTTAGGGLYLHGGSPIISNSIVAHNSTGGIWTAGGATPSLAYNDVWNNPGGGYVGTGPGATDFSTDPRFQNPAGGDFHLRADSPCIHTGDPNATVERDFEGDERPLGRGYDVGADESASYPDVFFTPNRQASGIPGLAVVHLHFLTNTGSITSPFNITHSLTVSGTGGWGVEYPAAFTLAAGEGARVPVTVTVPADAISGTYAILVLTATSGINPTIFDVVTNTTLVNWNPGVDVTPTYDEHLNPGTVVTYEHTVRNTGNATDTFNVTWTSSRGWTEAVTPTQIVDLGPHQTTSLWVRVAIPATAPGGLTETTLINLTSPSSGAQGAVTDTFVANHTVGSRYVATTGDDTLNNCRVYTTPCRTIAYAVGQAASGDLIKVAAGTYYEHDITLNKDVTLRGGYTTTNWTNADPQANPTVIDAQGLGRVLYIFGQPTVEGFTLQGGSTAGSGGGIYIYSLGSPVIRDNVITGNVASVYGGGVYNERGDAVLERNVLALNTADRGGGFASASGQPGFWNNAVYGNTANADGGGVYAAGGSPRIWHDTLYDNSAERGGGVFLAGGTPVVSNTVIVSNTASVTAGGVYSQAAGARVDYNNVWSNTGGDYVGLSGGDHAISADPRFVDAAAANFHLQEGSPCIDAGDGTDVAQDVDGQPRTMGSAPDMGLDEFVRPGVRLEPDRTGMGTPGAILYYHHVLTNTGTYTDTYDLSLSGWGSIVGPSQITLGAGLTQTVQVRVEVPAALSGTVGTSVLTATSTINPALSDTVVDTTTVGLAAGLLLEPDRVREASSAPPGTVAVVYTHFLTNTGNTTDTFDLIGTSDQGWTVSVAPATATLGSGTFTTVHVTVTIPAIPTDTVRIDTTFVTATSRAVITLSAQVTDTTYVNRRPGVALAPDRETTTPPGQTVVYHHTLTNTGNTTDTFSFTFLSSQGWNVTVPPPQTLGPGLTRTVGVTIPVPAGALSDTVDTTVITVTSTLSPAITARAVDTTTVERVPGVLLEPVLNIVGICVSSPPTQTILYPFDLTNEGNYTDTFDLTSHSSQGWNVSLNPLSTTLDAGGDTTVWAVVEVPSTTARLVDTTTVTATSRADPSTSDTAFYVTRVNWDIDVALEPDRTGTLILGNTIRYTHTVTNTGEETNTIDLDWLNEDGWPVSVSPTSIPDLGPGATATVEVVVTVPSGVIQATNRTTITATTRFYCIAHDTATDTTRVTRPDVTFLPDRSQSAPPGSVITYTHVLSNSGAVTDTYTITYSSDLGWPVSVAPTTVYSLPPGTAASVTAWVTVPMVMSYTTDALVITATSYYTDAIFDTVRDETTAAYLPSAVLAPDQSGQADAGGFTSYTHTLTNTGNYTDTFYLSTWSEFANAMVSPSSVELGPGEAYTPVVVTVLLPHHAAAGETERTEVIAFFAGRQAVAVDSTLVNPITGTRYVAPGGTNENNNCTVPIDYGPCATLQHAVEQASNGDEVRVAQGVYTDVHAINGITQVVRVDKSLVLRGGYTPEDWNVSDPVARPTVLDAGGQGRVVYMIGSGITPTLEGFHLRGGYASGTDNAGAGLYVAAGVVPTVRWNRIYNNTAAGNGSKGGGVYYGGGESPLLEGNTVYSNTAEDGGGLYLASGTPRVWNNVVYHNTASKQGGGLYAGGTPQVWNTTFYSNTAEDGGGLYLLGGAPVVSNTIVVGNSATAAGGGIYQDGGSPSLAYNNVWGNTPDDYFGTSAGAGSISAAPHFLDPAAPDLHLTRPSPCIDAGDPSTTLTQDRDGTPRPLLGGYDIGAYEYGLTGAVYAPPSADPGGLVTYTVAVTNVGPLQWTIPVTDSLHPYLDFVSLTATVGSGEYVAVTHMISWTGPVAANSTVYITFTTRITDWVAAGTALPNRAWVDHGATDAVTTTVNALPGPRYVATTGTDADNNCLMAWHPCRTVQWGVDQALTNDQVRVAAGTYTDSLNAGQVVSVPKSISLTGGYTSTTWVYDPVAYPTYLDGQLSGQSVLVTGSVTVTLAGFEMVSGTVGVTVHSATATITRCRIHDHAADGIAISSGSLTLQRTWLYANGDDGLELNNGSYRLENTVIAHNSGAGLRTTAATGQLLHTTFARNNLAGAVVDGTASFTNTIFYSHTVGISVTSGSQASLEATLWYSNTTNQAAGTLISTTNIYSNPAFINPDALNYHIRVGSGAVDNGVEAGLTEDIDGGLRPLLAGPDIGADEFPLAVTKGAPATADPGGLITYTFTLEGEASGLILTDTLPLPYVSYVPSSVACSAGTCSYLEAQQAITWTGDVVLGAAVHITYTTRVTDWVAAGVQVVNDAEIQVDGEILHTSPVATTVNALPGPRYVATTGTDADNNCLMAWHPCRTVQWGVDQALTNDQVRVAAGTYTDSLNAGQVVSVSKSISVTGGYTSTTWSYDPAAYPTYLDGQSAARSILITGPVTVTVAGFEVVSGSVGVTAYSATTVITRCRIHDHAADGIAISSGSLTLQRTWLYANGDDGLELNNGSYRLENTVIAHNSGAGLRTTAATGQLLHTTFARNNLAGAVVDGTASFTNTIFYSHTVGISVTSGSQASLEATLWYSNTTNQAAGTLISVTNTYGDPAFIDPDGMNYHIRGDSPALNAGVWTGVGEDVDGDLRPAGLSPDIGADQYPLRVARWAIPAAAHPCQVVTHTVRLTDLRATPFSTVRLTDTLDANASWAGTATATAGSAGYVAASHVVTWTGPVVTAAPTFITYTARITPYLTDGTLLTHTATISDGLSLFDGGASTVTVATLAAELAQKGPGQAAVGEVVTYTATFTVPAGHVAYQPLIVATLPRLVTGSGLSTTPALTYVAGSASPPAIISPDGGVLTWTLDTVTATCTGAAVETVTFAAQVRNLADNNAGDLLTATVTLSYTETIADGPAHLVTAYQTSVLVEPDPALGKEMEPSGGVGSLDVVTVTLTLTNTGTGTLYDGVVTDTLPAELAFLDGTVGYVVNDQVVSWTVGPLAPSQVRVFTVTVRVDEAVGAGQTMLNQATVWGTSQPGSVGEERVYADSTQATVTTGYPDLSISKERGPAVRSPGQTVTYTLHIANVGVVRAEGVWITDTLPLQLTDVVSATSFPATVEQAGRTVTWRPTTPMGRGETGTVWITATLSLSAGEGEMTNAAAIGSATTEPETANNIDSAVTSIRLPSLAITKTATPSSVLPGGHLTYTLTVRNAGLGDALNLVVSDTVPASTAYVSCAGGDACGESGGVVSWTRAALPAGAQWQVRFTVRVDASVDPDVPIRNQSYSVTCLQGVSASGTPVETPIGCVPVSIVDLTFSPSAPRIGQTVTFVGTIQADGTPPLDYTWHFGDGDQATFRGVSDTTSVVTHTYAVSGTHTVVLQVSNGCGTDQAQRAVIVDPYRIYLPMVLRDR